MTTANAYRARVVYPVCRPPILNGVVTVQSGRIVEVSKRPALGASVTDLGDVALLPGLINAHTHLEFSDLQQPLGAPNRSMAEWIRRVIADRTKKNRNPQTAIRTGLAESLASGVTRVGEIATCEIGHYAGVCPRPAIDLFLEVIGFSRARADSAFANFETRYRAALEAFEVIEANPNESERTDSLVAAISPHAPYTVGFDLFEKLIKHAKQNHQAIAMHLGESEEELQLLQTKRGPLRALLEERSMWDKAAFPNETQPLDYLKRLATAPRSLVIHGNFLQPIELDFLAQHRKTMSLIYCPRTHHFFGHPPYPLADAKKQGVKIALGTDSKASNPDLSLLADMRHVYKHHTLSPAEALELGTAAGAYALGVQESEGTLAPGKRANFWTIPMEVSCQPLPEISEAKVAQNSLEAILTCDNKPTNTWVHGCLQTKAT